MEEAEAAKRAEQAQLLQAQQAYVLAQMEDKERRARLQAQQDYLEGKLMAKEEARCVVGLHIWGGGCLSVVPAVLRAVTSPCLCVRCSLGGGCCVGRYVAKVQTLLADPAPETQFRRKAAQWYS